MVLLQAAWRRQGHLRFGFCARNFAIGPFGYKHDCVHSTARQRMLVRIRYAGVGLLSCSGLGRVARSPAVADKVESGGE